MEENKKESLDSKQAVAPGAISEPPQLNEVLDEVLEGVPQDAQKDIRRMMVTMASVTQRVSPQAELMNKITPEIVKDVIKAQNASEEREYKDRQNSRIVRLITLFLSLVALIIVIAMLKSNPNVLEDILKLVVPFLVGGVGGYGLGYKKGSSDD